MKRLLPCAETWQIRAVSLACRDALERSDSRPGLACSRDYWWKRSHLGLPVPTFEPSPKRRSPPMLARPAPMARLPHKPRQSTSTGAGESKRNRVYLSAPQINWDHAVIERLDPETLKTTLIPSTSANWCSSRRKPGYRPAAGQHCHIFSQADIRYRLSSKTST